LSKFPNGIPGIAAYVHGKGLKLGIYLTPGILKAGYDGNYPIAGTTLTTQQIVVKPLTNGNTENSSGASYSYQLDFTKPGAAQWLQNYADMLASWGVDYVMWDFVGPGGGNIAADDRANMEQWLIATQATPPGSRPIWIKLSNSLKFANAATWQEVANSWRIDGDVHGSWTDISDRYKDSPQWAPFEGATSAGGGWGDMDSLLVGEANNYASTTERRTAVTLWSICCSPLILGQDLTKLNSGDIPLITNPEVIAVDQAGQVATPGKTSGVWRAKNPDGSYTVGIFNMGGSSATITCSFSSDLGFSGSATVRDLWARTDLGTFSDSFSSGSLASHACRLLKITPVGIQQPAAAPVFSPGGGTYTSAQMVTITSATSGALIRYTTDGSTPTESNGTLYSNTAVSIATGTTNLQAIAYATGFTDSSVTSATYVIGVPQVAAPVFSPATGTPPLSVTITTVTGGATIHYTTDGSTPSETNGTTYGGAAVAISGTTTLRAIAFEAGFADSTVTSATYSLTPPTFNFEAASMSPVGTGATVSTSNDPNVTGGLLEFLNSTAVGQSITLTTPSIPAGTYQVQFRYKTNTSRCQHNVVIDGSQVGGTIDQYATTSTYPTAILGTVTFDSAATHTIVLTVTGKDSAATHYYISGDKFTFVGQ
jgi:alpha-galactosidase